MPFAFSQTINLAPQTNTRSGIIPIKWGFCADVDNMDIAMRTSGNVQTTALMYIGEPLSGLSCHGDFGSTSVESGNNETQNTVTQTESNWRTLEINPNAKEINFYVITRAGRGGDSNNSSALNCNNAALGRFDCCNSNASQGDCDYCLCVCDGIQCPVNEDGDPAPCNGSVCGQVYDCCPAPSATGGDAGYYKVNINLTNHNQESLWVYLNEFNGNSGSDCNETIKFQLFRSTKPFGDPAGIPDMTSSGLYVDFKAYPGENGSDVPTGSRFTCDGDGGKGCGSCGVICLPCPSSPTPADNSYFDTPYVNPSLNGSITITVTATNALEFWGANGNNGLFNTEFGWDSSSLAVNSQFISSNFGNTGASSCTPGQLISPNPSTGEVGECGCSGETFDSVPGGTIRTSGQIAAFEVK